MFNRCLSTLARCVTRVPWPRERADMSECPFLMRNSLNCATQRIVPVRTYLWSASSSSMRGRTEPIMEIWINMWISAWPSLSPWPAPAPKGGRTGGGSPRRCCLFMPDSYVKSPRASVPIVFFRTAVCTCSASTTTTSSTPPWREALPGGYLEWPDTSRAGGDTSSGFSQWVLFSELVHSVFGPFQWNNVTFLISLAHLWLCFMAAMKKEWFFFLMLDFFWHFLDKETSAE